MSLEGQLCGIPLAGPESFSQQQLDYLKRALGVDETVLYDCSNNYVYGTNSVTLSESYKNFEVIKILNSKGNVQFYYPANNQSVTKFTLYNITEGYLWLIPWTFTSNTVFAGTTGKMWTVGTTTAVDVVSTAGSNRWIQPIKIIGIHRISGGN
jgi:hypothetical protein